jgi:hypothetical protein
MAGNLNNMGLWELGNSKTIFKRKFRWTFAVNQIPCGGGSIPESFVKTANRPSYNFEETQIDFLHGRTWIPGKITWEDMEVVYYDVATTVIQPLWAWLISVYDVGGSFKMNSTTGIGEAGNAKATLTMYDGCGTVLELWVMSRIWPKSVNFGELDYSNSEPCTITLGLKYSNAQYIPICPSFNVSCGCVGCG